MKLPIASTGSEAGCLGVVVMRWWRGGQKEDSGIAAGQRFRTVGPIPMVWEVVTVARYPGDMQPHVRLVRVGTPHEGKTVSMQVLRDRRYYQPAR